ncbi:hypothetical protein OSSY52_20200 [Tepiditoga spiralis]|uniref:phospholipase D n=1 Tax=Tepiditoga spiralis TaxID=2108365 RepID=A0A7G1GC77_9BACT|nr:phospholipase D-like domain-containing protein [Tepiditoga spiralis]BBE31879.1 hypothetical protein OSSY52_20200 [Tepiditoga spiralis]
MKYLMNMKKLKFNVFFLLIAINSYTQIFYSGEILQDFVKNKIDSSNNIEVVTLTINKEILSKLKDKNYTIYAESTLNNSPMIILDKNKDGYLHEKFMIFDNKSILFGTGNFTESGLKNDFNVFIYTKDIKIVNLFNLELNNFKRGLYGIKKEKIDKKINSKEFGNVEFITSPSETIYKKIIKELNTAKKSINIFTFSFTDPFLLKELEKISSKNIKIKILYDDWNEKYLSSIKYMKGIELKKRNDIHAKIIVIDSKTLIIGSYNYTYRARAKNDEYILIIKNRIISEKINKKFQNMFRGE